jgi:TRAP-type C4-dicarboxylate transport system substrate-binding protein
VTLMNKTAFDRLDKPTQDGLLKVAAAAEARGWWRSQDKHQWYVEQLAARGLKVLPPSGALRTGLQQIGERLTAEWLAKAGADGQAVMEAYKKSGT